MTQDLTIVAVRIRPPEPVAKDDADRGLRARLHIRVEVQNTGDAPLHTFASRRSYDYDAATKTLSVYLTGPEPAVPPTIELISNHPRVPTQILVEPGSRATIDVPIPTTIRRSVPNGGLGGAFIEEPIEDIEQVDVHIQYSDVPFQAIIGEAPGEHDRRLEDHGHVVSATLTPNPQEGSINP